MANEDDHFGIGALYCTNDYIYANYYNNSSPFFVARVLLFILRNNTW